MEQQELDTFDEGPYTDGPMSDENDGEGSGEEAGADGQEAAKEEQGTEKVSSEAKSREEVDPDSQVNMLDNSEEKAEEKDHESDAGTGEEDKEPSEAAANPEGEEQNRENAGDTEEKVRNIKAFREGKQYEIPEDAELKVKVKGKWEKVPINELRDTYSGRVAYDEKFSDLNTKVKEFETREGEYNQEIGSIRGHLSKIADLTSSALKGEVNPIANVEYLLDLMGGNSLEYKKVMYENMAEELNLYSHMTELERDAFWTKQENNYLIKRQESLTKTRSEEQAQAELQQKVGSLREAHGISEEDYDSARDDLLDGGLTEDQLNPQVIVNAARMRPLLLEADRLLDPYSEQLSDEEMNSMSIEIAKTMFEAPSLPIEDIKRLLAEQYEVGSIVDTLVDKTKTSKDDVSKPNREPNHIESFDDYDSF